MHWSNDHHPRVPSTGLVSTAYGGDMFTEMHVAISLQRAFAHSRRYAGDSAPVTVREILKAATIGDARCAGLDDSIGPLTPDKQAEPRHDAHR